MRLEDVSEGNREWAMDVAENDTEKAAELLDRFERAVNAELPCGFSIDMTTGDVEVDSYVWEQLLLRVGNEVALESESD